MAHLNIQSWSNDERLAPARLFRWKKCFCLSLQVTVHQEIANKKEKSESKLYFILNLRIKENRIKPVMKCLKQVIIVIIIIIITIISSINNNH